MIAINFIFLPFNVTSVCLQQREFVTSHIFSVFAYPLHLIECLPYLTFHSYVASVMTHEITRAIRVIPRRRSFLIALSVRNAYWRHQTLRSGSVVMFTACLTRPDAVEFYGAEVCCWRASSADGSSATVTLDIVMTVSGMGEVVLLVVHGVLWTHGFRTWWTRNY